MEDGVLEEGMIVYAFRDERVRQMKENKVGEKTCRKEMVPESIYYHPLFKDTIFHSLAS